MRTSITGNRRGFTLVEVVVVIVIVAVLAAMIVPRLAGGASARQLRESARKLLTTAQYARDYAARHRRACRLVIDSAQGRYGLIRQVAPESSPNEFRPLTGVGRAVHLERPLRFERVRIQPRPHLTGMNPRRDCITFDSMGQADAAVVEITDGTRSISLLVAPSTGRARLVNGVPDKLPSDRKDLDA